MRKLDKTVRGILEPTLLLRKILCLPGMGVPWHLCCVQYLVESNYGNHKFGTKTMLNFGLREPPVTKKSKNFIVVAATANRVPSKRMISI